MAQLSFILKLQLNNSFLFLATAKNAKQGCVSCLYALLKAKGQLLYRAARNEKKNQNSEKEKPVQVYCTALACGLQEDEVPL